MCPGALVEIPFTVKRIDGRNLRLYLWARLSFKHPETSKLIRYPIEFQIDTGADVTTMSNRDMLRLAMMAGLTYQHIPQLPEKRWLRGVLGEKLPTYLLGNATLTFLTATGEAHAEDLEELRVIDIPKRDTNDPYGCHALLGMGLLERFAVSIDGPNACASMRRAV